MTKTEAAPLRLEYDNVRFEDRDSEAYSCIPIDHSNVIVGTVMKRTHVLIPGGFELSISELRDILAFMDSLNQSKP